MSKLKGYVLLGTALIACPCHLPITLALLAGTSLGGFIGANLGLVMIGLAGYFIVALFVGLRMLAGAEGRSSRSAKRDGGKAGLGCETCGDLSLWERVWPNGTHQRKEYAGQIGKEWRTVGDDRI